MILDILVFYKIVCAKIEKKYLIGGLNEWLIAVDY